MQGLKPLGKLAQCPGRPQALCGVSGTGGGRELMWFRHVVNIC